MSRKKHKRKHSKKTAAKMTLQQREAHTKNALNHGYYKKAIIHLKQMLKEDGRSEWKEWARTAHTHLAMQSFHEKKFQEVVRLYEGGHHLCDLSLDTPEYIHALLQVDQVEKALKHYLELQDNNDVDKGGVDNGSVDKSALLMIRSKFAASAVAGVSQIIEQLPADDPVVADFDNAFQLLNAYCSAHDEEVSRRLKLISFRSPYRDLRQVIAAALVINEDAEKARVLLARIATDSAFIPLAELLQLLTQDTQTILSSLSSLNTEAQTFVSQMKSWDNGQDKLLKKLASFPEEPDSPTLFRFADNFRAEQADYLYNVAETALVHAMARNNRTVTLTRFEKRFVKLSHVEQAHLHALQATLVFKMDAHSGYYDSDYELHLMEVAWEKYLNAITKNKTQVNQDAPFIKAQVYRYFVQIRDTRSEDFDDKRADYLQQSLRYDPEDKASHVRLLRYYLDSNKKLKKARDSINAALQYYPDDIQILLLAIEVAIAGNAFKKATGYAKAILKVDPINREARTLLANAHLAHSRKQVKAQKWHLVEKELSEAEQWINDPVSQAIVKVQRACMAQANKDNKQAVELLQALRILLASDLNASFILHLESTEIQANARQLHKAAKLKWTPAKKQGKDSLLALIDLCNTCFDRYPLNTISQVLKTFSVALKTVNKKGITVDEYTKIFEFLHRSKQDALLENYVKAARKQHGKSPLISYYKYINDHYLSSQGYDEVDEAISLAKEQGDTAIAARLIGLLEKSVPPMFPFDLEEDDFLDPFGFSDPKEEVDYSPKSELPEPLYSMLVDMIKHANVDEVMGSMQDILGLGRVEVLDMKNTLGEAKFRQVFIGCLEGKSPDEMIEDMTAGNSKKKKKNKQLDLFFGGDD